MGQDGPLGTHLEEGTPLEDWERGRGKGWSSGAKLKEREGDKIQLKGATFQCPSCGAYLQFKKGRLQCDYCGYSKPVHYHPSPIPYHPFRPLPVAEVEVEIGCPNCGATSKVPFRAISIRCPYCSTPLLGTFFNPAKPPALIPFRLTGKEAYQRGVEFLRKGFFIYRAFKREFQKFKEVKGFYFPLWLYNLQCQVQYRGERGIVTYEWVEVNGQMERRERVDWYPVAGELELQFKNVSYLALREKPLEQVYISQLHWNLPSAVQFQWEPLLGSEGYEYQLNSEIGLKRAQSSLEGRIRSAIRRDIGGDRQRILGYSTRWFNIEQSYLLVPVFHFSVKWRGKEYNVYINGESGEVTGERPVDKLLVGLVILGVAIVIGLIYYFYYKTTQGG